MTGDLDPTGETRQEVERKAHKVLKEVREYLRKHQTWMGRPPSRLALAAPDYDALYAAADGVLDLRLSRTMNPPGLRYQGVTLARREVGVVDG